MLQIEEACIAYGESILFSDFNMHLHIGETACISGESGRGKTSLLNAIMGFVTLKQGRIVVCNQELNIHTIDLVRKQIAWIPQELALPAEWVNEMIHLPFELKANRGIMFSKELLFENFFELGLEPSLYAKRVNEISGGQRQRIMIAVAAMLHKPLIIIDEPTSALDPGSSEKVMTFLNKQTVSGTSILAVSHDKRFATGCQQQIRL